MPTKKVKKEPPKTEIAKTDVEQKKLRLSLKGISLTLSIIFFIIWISIGAFLLVVIVQSLRQGAFAGLFSAPQSTPASANSQEASQTLIPGVGLVDVNCVKQALSTDSIQKIVSEGNTSSLTADEKTKLEPCILQKEASSPSPSPAK
jgi:hypothetical protein